MAETKELTQADIDAAIEKAVAPFKDKLEELQGKNAGLLDDLKKVQREARAAKEIKPEDLAAAEERADKAEADLAIATAQVKTLTTERDKATKALETESGFTQKLLIQDGLKSALISAGVKDEDYLNMAAASFVGSASVKVDGETRIAMIGDKPMADAIKEWAGTDAGKKVIAAPANGGGGAQGSGGAQGGGKTMTRSAFDASDPAAKLAFAKEGGKVVDA